jgi:aminopeptidase N
MNRTKLQKILNKLDGTNERTALAIRDFEGGVQTLREKLQQEISASTLEEVNLKINKLRKSVDLKPLLEGITTLENNFRESILSILNDIETKDKEYKTALKISDSGKSLEISKLQDDLSLLRDSLNKIVNDNVTELNTINNQLISIFNTSKNFATKDEVKTVDEESKKLVARVEKKKDEEVKDLNASLKELRSDLITRINNKGGGGNMNRNIAIGGNTSVLSMYTDINLKAGNNVTITYVRNNTTKYTDVTISATGGSGSVGGTIRSVNNISTSQSAGNTQGTDYVYICSAGVNVTLPSANANTNLYTIKNISTSSILVSRDGTDTIESDTSLILATQFTAVDLISDGTTNWNIT